jgi:hypothetical protein
VHVALREPLAHIPRHPSHISAVLLVLGIPT